MMNKIEFLDVMSKMLGKNLTYDEIRANSKIVNSVEKSNGCTINTEYHYLFSSYKMNKVVYFQENTVGELEDGDLYEEISTGFNIVNHFSFY